MPSATKNLFEKRFLDFQKLLLYNNTKGDGGSKPRSEKRENRKVNNYNIYSLTITTLFIKM
jgi:hypothetical protein